jgi:glycosyltransferase involved in cell wall biosynthesis
MDEGDTRGRHRFDVAILAANHFQVGLFQNGGGYRYFELALALQDLGLTVAVVCPGPTDFVDSPVVVLDQSKMTFDDICACSAVFVFCLLEDVRLVELLKTRRKTLIYDSFLSPVERMTVRQAHALADEDKIDAYFHGFVRRNNLFNRLADYFLVGEPEEKLLKLGELISTYRVGLADYRTLSGRMYPLPVIGYSRHNAPAVSPEATSGTMLWNGGLWNHYGGVETIMAAVQQLRAEGLDITFHFLYPNEGMTAYRQIVQRQAEDNPPWLKIGHPDGEHPDFFTKQKVIAGCRAIVLLYDTVLQLDLFLSMRLREVLLFEKPVIVSDFGVVSAFVNRHGIGLTVHNTVDGVRDAMRRLATDPTLYETLVGNIRRLKPRYDFANFVPPIARLITASTMLR